MREIKTLLLVLALLVAWSDGEKILFQASNSGSRQLKVKHSKVFVPSIPMMIKFGE